MSQSSSTKQGLTKCTIYVAEEYKGWQKTVLLKLQEMYSPSDNSLPPNNEVFLALKTIDELNPNIKKIMPFVQAMKESVSLRKADAFIIKLPFDEKAVLSANIKYLARTLEVS
jgi:hypothetical protein